MKKTGKKPSRPASDHGIDRPAKLGNPVIAWGSDVVAEVVRRLGVDYLALVPGSSYRGFHDSVVNYLGNRKPQMLVCLHEGNAVAIADGYGKVTERPMAVALHSNVGLMNGTAGIFCAWCDRTPMLVFGANGPIDADRRRPWIDWVHTTKDQGAMIRNYVKWDAEPASPEAAVEDVLRGWQMACTPPYGPVYISLDVTLQESSLTSEVLIPPVERYAPPRPPAVPAETVTQVIEALERAKFPLLLIGRVSRDQDDWDRRVALAEAIGAPVLTALHNPAAFPGDHPLHILPPGSERMSPAEQALLGRADLILSLDWNDLAGYLRDALGNSQTQSPTKATVVNCTLDNVLWNGWTNDQQALAAVDLPIFARPDDLVAQLVTAIGPGPIRGAREREATLANTVHWTEADAPAKRLGGDGALTVWDLSDALSEFCTNHPVSLSHVPIGFPGDGCRFKTPLDYFGKDGGGVVGTGTGHTVGTALALKDTDRITCGVIGDGDYLMGVNALWTAAHMRLPMMMVVANNRSYYNDEIHQERMAEMRSRPAENRWIGQQLDDPTPDIVALARGQGCDGEGPVITAKDLAAALERGAEMVRKGGRYVIDVHIDRGYATPSRMLVSKSD
jgi:thiamine pyrophosphate-dependent acetolactate synthase large subunit-like protein